MRRFSDLSIEYQTPDIYGTIWGDYKELTSLEGSPKKINGDFFCDVNNLSTLEFCPKKINGNFYCYKNPLKTIKHLKDTKGIKTLALSESDYMTKDDIIREIFEYGIKFEDIIIYDGNGDLIYKGYYIEFKREHLKIKYDIENF